jgi:hypothetical protein
MKKPILCRLGLHDFEIVVAEGMSQWRGEWVERTTGVRLGTKPRPPYYAIKICLRPGCNKIVDELTPAKKAYFSKMERLEKRAKDATEKFYNMSDS